MPFVAILGAGELGATTARAIASRGRVTEVRLIDEAADIAAGKALDIQQAGPIDGSATRVVAAGEVTAAVGAAAILVADAARPGHETGGEDGVALVGRLLDMDRETVVVCTGAAQRDLIARVLADRAVRRARVLGSAAEAVALALRAVAAIEADTSPAEVALTVLGRIPDRVVVPWQDATIAGRPLVRVLNAAQMARLARRAAALGPPGPYTLAAAASRVAEMLVLGSRKVVCCTTRLEGEFGLQRAIGSLPVRLGRGGIVQVVAPALDGRDQVLLENALYQPGHS